MEMLRTNLSTSNIPNIGFAINAYRTGKMSLPVSSASYIYSHFKHVSGVRAPEGTRGVAINKLKILDVLIEQLNQVKKRPDAPAERSVRPSDKQVDVMIEQYEAQIRQTRAANYVLPYNSAPRIPTGMLFDLAA